MQRQPRSFWRRVFCWNLDRGLASSRNRGLFSPAGLEQGQKEAGESFNILTLQRIEDTSFQQVQACGISSTIWCVLVAALVGESTHSRQQVPAACGTQVPRSGEKEQFKKEEGEEHGALLKRKNEVFIKNLDGKLMFVSFDDEYCVHDLHVRVAKQVGVSANDFFLVFPSRTLSIAQKLAEIVFSQEAQSTSKAFSIMVWRARVHCFWSNFKKDGSGYIAAVQNHVPKFVGQQQFAQNERGRDFVERAMGLDGHSAIRIQVALTARVPQVQVAPNNRRKKK